MPTNAVRTSPNDDKTSDEDASTPISHAAAAVVPVGLRRVDYEPEPTTNVDTSRDAAVPTGRPTPDLPTDPAARHTAQRLLHVIVEILDRRRPVNQLDGVATPAAVRCVRFARDRVHGACLVRVRVSQPHEKAIEVSAVCRTSRQVHAIAARFDHTRRHGWRCTAFRLI